MIDRWKHWARGLKHSVRTLYYALMDPRMPWPVRILASIVVGYAFSPIDLIPDFIPILGYLDDLILIPLGIALVVRFVPRDVWIDAQSRADAAEASEKPSNWIAGGIIVTIWVAFAAFAGWWAWQRYVA